jgi:hypothetical protein
MIDYQWHSLLKTAHNVGEMYAVAYGALNSMTVHHRQGALTCQELDTQRMNLNDLVEARYTELADEARVATEAWLNRSLEQLYTSVSTPKAAIYEDGAALGDQEVPE